MASGGSKLIRNWCLKINNLDINYKLLNGKSKAIVSIILK